MTESELRTLVVIGSIEIMLYFFPKQGGGVVVVIVMVLGIPTTCEINTTFCDIVCQ